VEQSRAVAEVLAAVMAAQRIPRDKDNAILEMKEACKTTELADRAFFRMPRGKENVTGPSVHLARELARCWGNIQYGVHELRRDDDAKQSEIQAFAWDVQTNSRVTYVFIVPHVRDTKLGPKALADMQGIYENNANAGARRVREAIFSVLPLWFREQAMNLCRKTLTDGGGVALAQRIANAIDGFNAMGVSEERLVAKLGKPRDAWTGEDVGELKVSYTSIQRGEVTKDTEFPAGPVTAEEITGPAVPPQDEHEEAPSVTAAGRGPTRRAKPQPKAAAKPAAKPIGGQSADKSPDRPADKPATPEAVVDPVDVYDAAREAELKAQADAAPADEPEGET
jgi:hypothetical protein